MTPGVMADGRGAIPDDYARYIRNNEGIEQANRVVTSPAGTWLVYDAAAYAIPDVADWDVEGFDDENPYGVPQPDDFDIPPPSGFEALREKAGLSRYDVVERTDTSRATVARLERRTGRVAAATAQAVLDVYTDVGVDHEYAVPAADDLAEMRYRVGATQRQVAELAGLSRAAVTDAEDPDVETRTGTTRKITDALRTIADVNNND